MRTIRAFLDQTLAVWKESTSAARFGIILLLLICLGAIVGVGIWSAQPNYVTLASNLEPNKSAMLMAALDQANISYQIKGAGSLILVDKRYFDQASILAGSRGISPHEVDLESTSPWMDPVNQQNVLRRNLEKQLSRSIQQFASIESATVHLSIPERQPFLRHSSPPTASVILTLASGQRFNEATALAVAQTVANAVPGMRPEQVAISDTAGNLYSNDESLGRLTKQEEYRINRERELTHKAQMLLLNFLGVGNARVEITADFSFPEARTTTKEFDPEKRVAISETIDTSSTTGGNFKPPVGVAGISSNVNNSRSQDVGQPLSNKTEVIDSRYEVSSTLREDIVRTPVMNLLTVSVLVNSAKVRNDAQEIPASVKASIEAMVKQAVGFRDGVDQFNLEFFEFVDLVPIDTQGTPWITWDQIQLALRNISLGIAAIVAFFLGSRTLKSMRPSSSPNNSQAGVERGSQVNQLSELVKNNPEVFSKILASWAQEAPTTKTDQPESKAA
ncbi:MAG TPA: flagellar basal-body MS-ring/collar protein FliF [Pirellulaceae bacterium]|nr:flagellar basal-body MS-ring/collar protein FliF [Pirellulaceae bacterium]HMO92876.1 flagellar basal-body MS-ring/collar protein FliF [Pirellulaceae bacterium]HMP71091.1 flagellar basal-body MS-ring/collar protein FliF [Pirellulaceae bacterium]